MYEFKDRVQDLRVMRSLSPSQLGAAMNKSEGAVRSWETGKAKPDVDTLIKLAEYFDCTTDYLLGLSEFENKRREDFLTSHIVELSSNISAIPSEEREKVIKAFTSLAGLYIALEEFPVYRDTYMDSVISILDILDAAARMYAFSPRIIDNIKQNAREWASSAEYRRLTIGRAQALLEVDALFETIDEKMREYFPALYRKNR